LAALTSRSAPLQRPHPTCHRIFAMIMSVSWRFRHQVRDISRRRRSSHLAHGVATGQDAYVSKGLAALGRLFPA
jgi:hypothetical protein